MKEKDATQPTEFKTTKAAMYDIVVQKSIEDEEKVLNLPTLVDYRRIQSHISQYKLALVSAQAKFNPR